MSRTLTGWTLVALAQAAAMLTASLALRGPGHEVLSAVIMAGAAVAFLSAILLLRNGYKWTNRSRSGWLMTATVLVTAAILPVVAFMGGGFFVAPIVAAATGSLIGAVILMDRIC